MNDAVFLKHYKALNKAQREAVDTIEGPVMVVAGPGTGKTQILTLRIANILRETDTQPEQILALTFTEAGVTAMRKRLQEIIGVRAYRVPIFTFHGFCNEVIGRFSSHFPELIGSRPASEVDCIILMQTVFDSTELTMLASLRSPYHYVSKVLAAISLLKREALKPDDLRVRLDEEARKINGASDYRHEKGPHKGKVKGEYLKREEALAKNKELALLYGRYEKALAGAYLYDFDDMIFSVAQKLSHDEQLRLILQEEYQYLLADEHQDANGAQNKVLELLASFHKFPNLFIVGDDKQAIYRFQGASLENFQYFTRRFPEAKIISLTDNYRSTQTILDCAHQFVSRNPRGSTSVPTEVEPLGHSLLARAGHAEQKVFVTSYSTLAEEAAAVAREIKARIESGTPAEEIALFTRTNKELATYAQALARAEVPVAVESKEHVLDDVHIEKLLVLVRAVIAVGEDGPLVAALHLDCFQIPELDIFLLTREATRRRRSIWSLVSTRFNLVEISSAEEILRVARLLQEWAKLGANESLALLLSTIAQESGLLAQWLALPDGESKLQKFEVMLKYIENYTRTHRHARLSDVAQLLALLDTYNVLETRTKHGAVGKVQLMTAHRAKGLEYDVVYVVNLIEGNWSGRHSHVDFKIPGLVATTKEDEEADERRLFFVALTRARKTLAISYPQFREDGTTLMPARFLSEIPDSLAHKTALCKESVSVAERAHELMPPTYPQQTREQLIAFVRETLRERGLAVTGLNNYLSCPWKYFYRNLLRVPEPQAVPMMFGNVVHRALRAHFDSYAKSEEGSKKSLLIRFEQELEREAFNDKELAQAKTTGRVALAGYYDRYAGTWSRAIKNEFPVDVVLPLLELELRLTGKLDKLEFLSEKIVRAVDYKTGQPKSRNELEGKTKNANGDYKRQLVFYKLLLEQDHRYQMQSGMIDFVMPTKGGRYVREEFIISAHEVAMVREQIACMVHELCTLSFWDKQCDDAECFYCGLRALAKLSF